MQYTRLCFSLFLFSRPPRLKQQLECIPRPCFPGQSWYRNGFDLFGREMYAGLYVFNNLAVWLNVVGHCKVFGLDMDP